MSDLTFWDAREDVPLFAASYPSFHPIGWLARLLIPPEYSVWVIAFLVLFSLASCIGALKIFLERPDGKRWALVVLAFALAILGDLSGSVVPLLLAIASILAWRFTTLRILWAAFVAVLLTAWWWLPLRELHRNPAPSAGVRIATFHFANDFFAADHLPGKIREIAGDGLEARPRGGSIEVVSALPGDTRLRLRSHGWNLLVSNLPAWQGWRVYWNGQRLPPVRSGDRVATFVPPGAAELMLRYRPDALDVGLRIAGLGLILMVLSFGTPRLADAFQSISARFPEKKKTFDLLKRQLPRWIGILLLIIYAGVLLTKRVRVTGGSDTSGYLNQARMLTRGELSVPLRLWHELRLPEDYLNSFPPLGFTAAQNPGFMVATYPIGTPLHLAFLRMLGGDPAMFLIGTIAAVSALALMFLMARRLGLQQSHAFFAAAVLALCPVFVFNALYPVSDILAVAWALGAMLAAFRASESWRWGLLAGAAVGAGVLIRPSQLMLLPAVLIAARLRWKPLVAIVAGGLPFAVIHLSLAEHLFGNPFRTGYGEAGGLFDLSNFPDRVGDYSFWLARLLPLVFPMGFGALVLGGIDRTARAALAAWFLAFFLFYCFYDVFGEWGSTRFLLPAMPALILLFFLGVQELLKNRPIVAGTTVALILVIQILSGRSLGVLGPARGDEVYREAVTGARKITGPNAVVIGGEMTGAWLYYNGDIMIRIDSLHPDRFELLRGHASIAGRKWFALVPYFEIADLHARAPAPWIPVATFRDVTLFELRPPD